MSWREQMNADIKRYFAMPETAEVLDIDTETQERGSGCCEGCQWTAVVIEVTFGIDGDFRFETYEGGLSAFLTAVSDYADTSATDAPVS